MIALFEFVLNILLTPVFFLVFTPINIVLKIFRYDPMKLKFKRSKTSFFVRYNSNPAKRYAKGERVLFVKDRQDSDAPDTIYPMW